MRTPRRSFAAPFVITMVGAGSAGFTSCNPPAQTRPDPVIATNPPRPVPDPDPQPQTGARRWTVYKQGEDCFAGIAVDCPKPEHAGDPVPTCNPPPPVKYACPENLTMDRPIEIAQDDGATECHVVPPPIECPPNAICNPPRPMRVECPTR